MRGENRNCDCTTAYRTYILRLRPALHLQELLREHLHERTATPPRSSTPAKGLASRLSPTARGSWPLPAFRHESPHRHRHRFDGFGPNWGQYRKRPKIGRAVNGVKHGSPSHHDVLIDCALWCEIVRRVIESGVHMSNR